MQRFFIRTGQSCLKGIQVRCFSKTRAVTVIGSGNWGSVATRLVAQNVLRHSDFDPCVKMWVHDEELESGIMLSSVINETKENVKYLPGVELGSNVLAVPDLQEAVAGSELLVFVMPHQYVRQLCPTIKAAAVPGAEAISLIKGMDVTDSGFELISSLIEHEVGIPCSVLMGANIASEVGRERFSEATVGYADGCEAAGALWTRLFHTHYFHVRAVPDVVGCELCGTLKNIVALGAGFVDGLELGNNTKAAIIRIGLVEMQRLARQFFPSVRAETYFESAGIADLITTCFGGRNRRCAEAFARSVRSGHPQSWEAIEADLLSGQKLQGVLTSHEVQAILKAHRKESEFPLFTTINRICCGELPPDDIVRYADLGYFDHPPTASLDATR